MRIIIIRHAEPDYEHNTITPRGQIEAEALSERLIKEKIDFVYMSPLGRAMDTAKPYLQKSKKEGCICPWLEEFKYLVKDETVEGKKEKIAWDFKVKYLTSMDDAYDNSKYRSLKILKNSDFNKGYEYVTKEFDTLLAKHGYERCGKYYHVTNSNKDTIVFFCHLGLESILLSHLFSIPSILLAQHIALAPSSVSVLYSEEREEGVAQFRAQSIGDLSHLYCKGIEPSFMGRFRENAFDDTRK